ncbi:MAG: hypothetical protein PWP31_1932 [Clostridia bacterium]|nr:hypothetical protein [Clostridia bacterium]
MDIGESLVGSYFKYVLGCKVVVYNCHLDTAGEIDIIALTPDGKEVYICEVSTHLRGLQYGKSNSDTLARITHKMERAAAFATANFPDREPIFMLWAPVVSRGLTRSLREIQGKRSTPGIKIKLMINRDYTASIHRLREVASKNIKTTDEPAFRMLQILEHLK